MKSTGNISPGFEGLAGVHPLCAALAMPNTRVASRAALPRNALRLTVIRANRKALVVACSPSKLTTAFLILTRRLNATAETIAVEGAELRKQSSSQDFL